MRLFPASFLICSALVLAACGTATLEAGSAESQIKKGLESELGLTDVEVSCPDGIVAKEGEEFECDITAADDSEAAVQATQTDDDGSFTWENEHLANGSAVSDEIVSQNDEVSEATCPTLLEAKEGEEFDCTVVYDDDSEEDVTIVWTDDEGSWELA